MTPIQIPSNLKRILKISMLLIFISAATAVFFGESTRRIDRNIAELNMFLEDAEHIQPNFEKSLEAYTGETKEAIDYLDTLRPDSEEDIVEAISQIEEIGRDLSLIIELKSLDDEFLEEMAVDPGIRYSISFFGTIKDLQDFISHLESLDLFIKVEEINFENTKFLDAIDLENGKNTNLRIKLYTK